MKTFTTADKDWIRRQLNTLAANGSDCGEVYPELLLPNSSVKIKATEIARSPEFPLPGVWYRAHEYAFTDGHSTHVMATFGDS